MIIHILLVRRSLTRQASGLPDSEGHSQANIANCQAISPPDLPRIQCMILVAPPHTYTTLEQKIVHIALMGL